MIVLPSDSLGGAEQYLYNIARYYSDNGYKVDVFFLYQERSKKWRGILNVKLYFTSKSSEIRGLLPLISNLRKYGEPRYDYIFSSHQHINALLSTLVFLGIIKKTKLICRESTSVYLRFSGRALVYHRLFYFFYRSNIDLIVCQTPEMKSQLLNGYQKFINYNVQVIRNPILLSDVSVRAKVESSFNFPDQFILAIGRLNPVKKFDKLIRAYYLSKAKNDYKLIILGAGTEYNNLRNLIIELGLIEQVILVGHVENVFPFIKRASLGVISSAIEGFPNVILQMYALNLKVVSTNCCGGLDLFPDLYLCNDNTVEEIALLCDRALNDRSQPNFSSFIKQFDIKYFIKKINDYV